MRSTVWLERFINKRKNATNFTLFIFFVMLASIKTWINSIYCNRLRYVVKLDQVCKNKTQ